MVEHRQKLRFDLRLPLRVMRHGAGAASDAALTRNISSGGVLFGSDAEMRVGAMIEYEVTLARVCGFDVDVRCVGKIVRLDKSSVAATLDRYQFVRRET